MLAQKTIRIAQGWPALWLAVRIEENTLLRRAVLDRRLAMYRASRAAVVAAQYVAAGGVPKAKAKGKSKARAKGKAGAKLRAKAKPRSKAVPRAKAEAVARGMLEVAPVLVADPMLVPDGHVLAVSEDA
jgi:hypothetical protein